MYLKNIVENDDFNLNAKLDLRFRLAQRNILISAMISQNRQSPRMFAAKAFHISEYPQSTLLKRFKYTYGVFQ